MKSYVAIISVILAVSYVQGDSALKERKKAVFTECATRSKVDQETAKSFYGDKIPTNEKERCLLKCVYEKSGMVLNNEFNAGIAKAMAILAFSGDELVKLNNLIDKCAPIIKPDASVKCDVGRAVRECFHNKGKEVGFFPHL